MDFGVLGPLRVLDGEGRVVGIGPPKLRLLTAILLCRTGPTSPRLLAGELWGDQPPARATDTLRVYMHHLRRALGPCRVRRQATGYEVAREPTEVDSERFRRLVAESRERAARGDRVAARAGFRAALGLWRGPAFADGAGADIVATEATALDTLRLDAYEWCFELELALGRHAEVVAELRDVSTRHPLRERARAQLMIALARSGRTAEALVAYEQTRRLLAGELGTDPGPALRDLYRRLLHGETLEAVHPVPPDGGTLPPGLSGHGRAGYGGATGHSGATGHGATAGGSPVPGSPGAVRPAQLPGRVPGYVGREAELGTLDSSTSKAGSAPVLVAGPAGIGKTALVVRWAHGARHRFPDGQIFLDLNGFAGDDPLPPDQALGRLLTALGVPAAEMPRHRDERAALWRSLLSDRRVLVVLDNAGSSQQVRSLLPGGATTTIVTSRRRLDGLVARDGATLVPVPPLSRGHSVELLSRLLHTTHTGLRSARLRTIASLCGGLPLAVRVAAARLNAGALTVEALAAQLADESTRLSALTVEDGDTAVRATLSTSYRTLAEPVARTFRLIGLHAGPRPTLGACAALVGRPAGEVREHLEVLVEGHLLARAGSAGYAMHDLVRLFAAERAATREPPPARDAGPPRLSA